MHRAVAWVVAVGVVAVMVAPALTEPPNDGFPLSTYPMFAVDRGERVHVSTAVGYTATDERVRLSPTMLAGADEPILAVRTASNAVARGEASEWCDEVAQRVGDGNGSAREIVRIEVVTEIHDAVATITRSAEPIHVESHATCSVVGR